MTKCTQITYLDHYTLCGFGQVQDEVHDYDGGYGVQRDLQYMVSLCISQVQDLNVTLESIT